MKSKVAAYELIRIARNLMGADRLEASIRSRIIKELSKISTHNAATYYRSIPMDKVFKVLKDFGLVVLDEDGTELKGYILTGRDGHTNFDIGRDLGDKLGTAFANTLLHLNWHKMEPSGNYEFTATLT